MASTTHKDRPFGGHESIAQQAQQAGQQVKEAAGGAYETMKDVATAAGKKASEAASYVGQKAEDATAAVGGGMKSLAGTIRENTPREGMIGNASSAVAGTLESGGRYLEQHGLKGVGEDFTNLIRRNPIPALLIGVGVGFLLARATRN